MSDFNEIINSDKPTLVDFWAPWCGPCKMMTPIIEETKSELGDKANVLKVNVDNNKEVSVKYNVRSIPTVILFKNGNPVWRQSGVVQKNVLINEVNKVV
jgi:thioredoxin 1|tara:strand:- start:19 stop:315 length:297 start_codon:yes stop_codon:yes gene_type:complete